MHQITGAALRLRGSVMPGADAVCRARERDKLTIAEVCADLGISDRRSMNGERRAGCLGCFTLPDGSLRVHRSGYQRWLPAAGSPSRDHRYTRSSLYVFLRQGGPILPGTKMTILPEEFWA
jgi:hypothetical protein